MKADLLYFSDRSPFWASEINEGKELFQDKKKGKKVLSRSLFQTFDVAELFVTSLKIQKLLESI